MRTAMLRVTRNFGLRLLILLPVMFLFVVAGQAQSTKGPTSVFQLNGDPGPEPPSPGVSGSTLTCDYTVAPENCDNWDLLNGTTGLNGSAGHSLVKTFRGGGAFDFNGNSKDTYPISGWGCSGTSAPPKDTLNDAYAAAYKDSDGDFNLIFGADRAAPNGDANIGLWFFQEPVTCQSDGSFSGAHEDGDIFAISSFTTGGGVSTIIVYEWDSADCSGVKSAVKNPSVDTCADTNLKLIAEQPSSSECTANAPTCGVTNSVDVNPTWSATVPTPDFYEGGLDLNEILNQSSLPCFSSFMVETRSSPSISATLKAFIVGGFNVCGMSISKGCGSADGTQQASVSEDGTTVNYPTHGKVTNTGVGTLYDVTVCDLIGGSTTPVAISVDNGSTSGSTTTLGASGGSEPSIGTWSNTSQSTSASLGDTAYAVAWTSPQTSPPSCTLSTAQAGRVVSSTPNASASCTFSASGTLSVTKYCHTSLAATGSDVQVQVAFHGMVCNNAPSEVTGIELTENDSSASPPPPALSTTMLGPCDAGVDDSGSCNEKCVGTWVETSGDSSASCSSTITVATCPAGDVCIPGNCATYTGSYTPTSDTPVEGGTGPGRYTFSDTIAVTSAETPVQGVTLTTLSGGPSACNGSYGCATATCPICPGTLDENDSGSCP